MLRTPIGRLRAIGFVEGLSFLVLLGIAMPLKYLSGMPTPVTVIGWIHGLLFVLYLVAVAEVARARQWQRGRVLAALAAAVLPFGTFVFDTRLRREAEAA